MQINNTKPGLVSVVLLFLSALTGPYGIARAESSSNRPHWSLEIKGGRFYPDLDDWEIYYGRDHTTYLGLGFGYKFLRQLEVGAELGYIEDKGTGYLPSNSELGGRVTYNLYPLQTYVVFRAIFNERQWVVPYVGGGWTFSYYQESIDNQDNRDGWANGYNARVGLQFLLNRVEPSAAATAKRESGLDNTYLYLEAQTFSSKNNDIELGGTNYLLGVLLEF